MRFEIEGTFRGIQSKNVWAIRDRSYEYVTGTLRHAKCQRGRGLL